MRKGYEKINETHLKISHQSETLQKNLTTKVKYNHRYSSLKGNPKYQ